MPSVEAGSIEAQVFPLLVNVAFAVVLLWAIVVVLRSMRRGAPWIAAPFVITGLSMALERWSILPLIKSEVPMVLTLKLVAAAMASSFSSGAFMATALTVIVLAFASRRDPKGTPPA